MYRNQQQHMKLKLIEMKGDIENPELLGSSLSEINRITRWEINKDTED